MDLAIYGAGGMGRVLLRFVHDINRRHARWKRIVFVDDRTTCHQVSGCPVLSFEEVVETYSPETLEFVISLGEPSDRKMLFHKVKQQGFSFGRIVSTENLEANDIGEGVVLGLNSTATANTHISENVMILSGCNIGHDTCIGAHSVFCANVAVGGMTNFGENCFVGMGATISDHINVGAGTIISMGSAVHKSTSLGAMLMGNPARAVPRMESSKIFK